MNKVSWGLVGAATVLISALIIQFVRIRDVHHGDMTSPRRSIRLSENIPQTLPNWIGTDEPLGPTELATSHAEKMLNSDDTVNRVFRTTQRNFGIYVAYWSAGRMPVEKVASHTPDRCWTENGWICREMRYPEIIGLPSGPLKPAYWRVFSPAGGGPPQHVMYWHLVGGELHDYGGGFNQQPGVARWWSDMLWYAFKGSGEQYFIRLTSDRPFAELRGDPGFEQVLQALGRLGLAAKGRPGARRLEN